MTGDLNYANAVATLRGERDRPGADQELAAAVRMLRKQAALLARQDVAIAALEESLTTMQRTLEEMKTALRTERGRC